MNFIYPNSDELDLFMDEVMAWGGPLIVDEHWYLNWAGDLMLGDDKAARNWTQVHQRACHAAVANWEWCAPGHELGKGKVSGGVAVSPRPLLKKG